MSANAVHEGRKVKKTECACFITKHRSKREKSKGQPSIFVEKCFSSNKTSEGHQAQTLKSNDKMAALRENVEVRAANTKHEVTTNVKVETAPTAEVEDINQKPDPDTTTALLGPDSVEPLPPTSRGPNVKQGSKRRGRPKTVARGGKCPRRAQNGKQNAVGGEVLGRTSKRNRRSGRTLRNNPR